MEVVGATEGLILSMEEILKSCISYYNNMVNTVSHYLRNIPGFRISELSTVGPRRFSCIFWGGDLVNQPLSARFAMQAFPNWILRFMKAEILLNKPRDDIYFK